MYYDTMDKQIDFENLESLTGETDEKYEAFVENSSQRKQLMTVSHLRKFMRS